MTGLVEGAKYVDLSTSWHGLGCRNPPDCCMPERREGSGLLLLNHAAYNDGATTLIFTINYSFVM